MGRLQLPAEILQDAVLTEAEILPAAKKPPVPGKWIEAIDAATGHPYAYQTQQSEETANFVKFTYNDDETTYLVTVSGTDQPTVQFYDSNPSSSKVYDISGTQVYRYINPDGDEDHLIWSSKVDGGSFVYSVMSTPVDTKKQIAVAESIIHGYSEDR